MAFATASSREQHRCVDQRVQADQIEQVLEQARVGTAIDRCGNDQQVGLFDGQQLGFDLGRQFITGQGAAQRPGDVTQFDQRGLDWQQARQFGQHGLGQHQCAGWAPGSAGEGNNIQGTGHKQFLFQQWFIAREVKRLEQAPYQRLQALIYIGCALTAEQVAVVDLVFC